MTYKSGFVNIIGNPNVGKSTLMNALVGERLSVITSKAQTTRHRILGIVNGENHQIVFSDTPGILEPRYLLQETMMHAVDSALQDADVFLLVTEAGEHFNHPEIVEIINKSKVPVIIAINKIDLKSQEQVAEIIKQWEGVFDNSRTLPISAKELFNIESLFIMLVDALPEGDPYYPTDELTDRSERFFASEIIRGKVLELYRKEVPYCTEVTIDEFEQSEKILKIRAVIHVARESQKIILIGDGGKAIKKLGIESRKDMEKFFGQKIFLELFVKVNKDWRENQQQLKRFGYL